MIDEPTRRLDEGALRGFGRDLIPRALAGLVREIADAFYVPEATMVQRISRAKRALQGRRLDQLGDLDGNLPAAGAAYAQAARRATDVAERDHLVRQAARARAGKLPSSA